MDVKAVKNCGVNVESEEELKRGTWTDEEDFKLVNYISIHGEGRWNSLARCAGLKCTGKSCRLRWLNYLRPDVRHGNITSEEQLLIIQLHSRWGNRWSRIAQHLPGRTDNEIKNFWRTRVQKHAKRLKCDVNSKEFEDTIRYLSKPRLAERIRVDTATTTVTTTMTENAGTRKTFLPHGVVGNDLTPSYTLDSASSSTAASFESIGTRVSPVTDSIDYYSSNISIDDNTNPDCFQADHVGYRRNGCGIGFESLEQNNNHNWLHDGDASDSFLNTDDIFFLH